MEAWARIPDVSIVAAADADLARATRAAPHAYCSAEEMFEREALDFVDIATRPDSHLPLVRLAVQHRTPAICQKPMAESWDEAVEMVTLAEANGTPLMIHENWRWQPWFREIKRLLDGGVIGIPLAYFFRTRQNDGRGQTPYPQQPYFRSMPRFLIYETLVHQIDTSRFLFGSLRSVFARITRLNPAIEGEDRATLVLSHASGLQGVVDGHRFLDPQPAGPAMGDSWFEGDAGILNLQATGDISLNGERVWSPGVQLGYKGDSVRATHEHFVTCLRHGTAFETNGRDYLRTYGAVEAAYASAASGRLISLHPSGAFE
jgi:predicted dehydrogenase